MPLLLKLPLSPVAYSAEWALLFISAHCCTFFLNDLAKLRNIIVRPLELILPLRPCGRCSATFCRYVSPDMMRPRQRIARLFVLTPPRPSHGMGLAII